MDNYIRYAYYDDDGRYIAIVYPNTPKEIIQKYLEEYDEVKYKE